VEEANNFGPNFNLEPTNKEFGLPGKCLIQPKVPINLTWPLKIFRGNSLLKGINHQRPTWKNNKVNI